MWDACGLLGRDREEQENLKKTQQNNKNKEDVVSYSKQNQETKPPFLITKKKVLYS